ncbi:MAG: hypothetical protein DRQ99_26190, partial [Candidatus Parabeggiatoa sp. nov. 3]
KGRHAGLPLPNPTYSGVVGANLRVRPGQTRRSAPTLMALRWNLGFLAKPASLGNATFAFE